MNFRPLKITIRPRLLPFAAAVLLCSLQLLFLIPAAIYAGNPEEFNFGLLELLPHGLPWLIAFFAAMILLGHFLPDRLLKTLTVLLICLGIALYCQSALLLWDYGQFDGTDIAWDKHSTHGLIDAAVWCSIFLAGLYLRRRIVSCAPEISVFILVLELIAIVPPLFSAATNAPVAQSDARYEDLFRFSPSKNAVIIVLDSLQSPVFAELLKRDPALAQEFRDFTFLPNTTSSFPSTLPSVPAMLSGVAYDSSTSLFEYFTETIAKKSLPVLLRSQGFQVSLATLPGFCRFFQAGECAEARRYPSGETAGRSRQEYIELLDYALFRAVPHHLKRPVYNDDRWVLRELIREETAQRSRIDGSIQLVNRFEAESQANAVKPTFKFVHLLLPHPPLRVDAQCMPLTRGTKMSSEGYLDQARCALRQASRLIEKFKALGVYDNSMILITADHGLRLDYGTNDPAYSKQQGLLQVSRALPLLLVKPFSHKGEMAHSQVPAQLIDIPKTLAVALGAQQSLPGENILALSEDAKRERLFTDLSLRWAYWKETKSTDPGSTSSKYIAHGNAWDPHTWSKAD